MRLIDADKLIKSIEHSRNNNPHKNCHFKRKHEIEHLNFMKMVADQPTAFDKEKVVKQIEDYRDLVPEWALKEIIEIVKKKEG